MVLFKHIKTFKNRHVLIKNDAVICTSQYMKNSFWWDGLWVMEQHLNVPFLLHQQWDHFPMLLNNFIDQLLLSDLYDNENPLHGKLKCGVFTIQRVSIG